MNKTSTRLLILMAVVMVALTVTAAAFAKATPNTGFDGKWKGVDVDGSNVTLRLKLEKDGLTYRARYFDDGASVCGVDEVTGEPTHKAMLRGKGVADDLGSLAIDFKGKCLPNNGHVKLNATLTYTYDEATDTLTEVETGVVYTR